jgi:ClpP class serine protease
VKGAAADWVLAQPWAITEEALGVVLSIAERTNESVEAVEAKLGRPLDNTHETTVRDGVALIPVSGPISRYANIFSQISGATAIDTLARDFRTALDDRSVRAIVLQMDTPGGTVAGVSEFADHVKAARGQGKPIVAYVGSQAASAGYWIASAADRIVADPTATLGSIGVVMGLRKPAAPKDGQAKTIEFVSSQSPRKRPDPETEAGRAQIQATADDLADVFIDAVASNRGVPRDAVLSDFGQGGSFVGGKAVAAGMADGLGSLESVISSLSRGEMPCPPSKPKPARKAEPQPRRAAMSEPNEQTMSAAEAAELRKQVEQFKAQAEANAKVAADSVKARIAAEGSAFYGEMLAASKLTPGEKATVLDAFSLAAQDDHDHPIAGRPNARQDALRSVYEKRTPHTLTKEVVAGDPARQTRAMGMDPADEQEDTPEAAEQKELDEIEADARKWALQRNGSK